MVATKTPEDFAEDAKRSAGGPSALARSLGDITSQAISKWQTVPADRVLAVEALTGISRHDLRPDIFGPAPSQGKAEAA